MSFVREEGKFVVSDNEIQIKSAATWVTEDDNIPDPKIKRCLNEYVVVRPLKLTNKMESATGFKFYIPDTTVEKNEQLLTIGRVVAVGEYAGKRDNVSKVEIGDIVLYPRHGGSRVTIQGVKVLYLYDDALLSVLNPEDVSLSSDNH